jgi:hypothetical protein
VDDCRYCRHAARRAVFQDVRRDLAASAQGRSGGDFEDEPTVPDAVVLPLAQLVQR